MKIEAKLFTKLLKQVREIAETLGYKVILLDRWFENNDGNLEFLLADGESKSVFSIVLPKPFEQEVK